MIQCLLYMRFVQWEWVIHMSYKLKLRWRNTSVSLINAHMQSQHWIERIDNWSYLHKTLAFHDDVIKWKHFPRYWPFVRRIHRSPVNSPHRGQWRGALMFSLICVWINGLVNNREAGDLRRHRAHYDVSVMIFISALCEWNNHCYYFAFYYKLSCFFYWILWRQLQFRDKNTERLTKYKYHNLFHHLTLPYWPYANWLLPDRYNVNTYNII